MFGMKMKIGNLGSRQKTSYFLSINKSIFIEPPCQWTTENEIIITFEVQPKQAKLQITIAF